MYLKECAHRLLGLSSDTTHNNNFIDCVAVDFAHVIRPGLRLLYHLEGHGCEDSILAALTAEVTTLPVLDIASVVATEEVCGCTLPAKVRGADMAVRLEETLVVVAKHFAV